jgi:hypothetical protein
VNDTRVILRLLRACSRGKPEYGAKAVPARGFAVRSRAVSGPRSSGTMTGPRGARCTGAGEGPPVRTRRFQETRPEVEPRGQSLGERRSGAPGGVGALIAKRAAAPPRLASAVATVRAFRRSAPSAFWKGE